MGLLSGSSWIIANILMAMNDTVKRYPYSPPDWWSGDESKFPKNGRISLANLPTPIHNFKAKNIDLPFNLMIKRDDMTGGIELSGNKVRKLEFLIADALARGFDCVVTIGGEQSNHCRATAAAARMVGLTPALVLRTSKSNDDNEKLGLTGNLLVNRMTGTTLYSCTPGEYGRFGSSTLLDLACSDMRSHGFNPYAIPVGGSNAIGTWGYIEAVNELYKQLKDSDNDGLNVDHIVFACGSGGTAAGITLGVALACSEQNGFAAPIVHAVGVCDNPDYFYAEIIQIGFSIGLFKGLTNEEADNWIRSKLVVHQGKGKGYALSTDEELNFCIEFSIKTGIILDPVYTGKAMYHFINNVVPAKLDSFEGKNVLFWHTGGSLGMFDKQEAITDALMKKSPLKKLQPYDNLKG